MSNLVKSKKATIEESFKAADIANTLSSLMKDVTKKECSPQTVHAACQCANAITDLMKVCLDAERVRMLKEADI
jgi:orotidine-5'-phosphate decarboxylase